MNSQDLMRIVIILSIVILIVGMVQIIRKYLEKKSSETKATDLSPSNNTQFLQLKLQAYERLSLLLERTSIPTLIQTYGGGTITAKEFRALVITAVNQEFNHNLTQQIYVSENTWNVIKAIKEQTLTLFQEAEQKLPATALSTDLAMAVIETLKTKNELPHEIGLRMIKKEIQINFG